MSYIQEILKALAVALHDGLIGEEGCEDLAKALNGVPIEHHMNAFRALLGIDPTNEDAFEKPAEAPEDYLAVKTFASSEFHIGDEVQFSGAYGEKRGVVLSVNSEQIHVLFDNGVAPNYSSSLFTRTGRSFPAIPAIMEELKKA